MANRQKSVEHTAEKTPATPHSRDEATAETCIQSSDPGTLSAITPTGRLRTNDILTGRFRIIRFIAAGGMGEVYEVEDQRLQGVRLALKTILPHIAARPDMQQRFEREVLLARRVTHPNLCPIYDIFHCRHQDEDLIFLTMKLLPGETLSARIDRDGPIPFPEAGRIVEQVAAALSAAHEAGILHRDIKLANIMLDGSGTNVRACVTDFGLARAYQSETTVITADGIAGTPGYLAPELIQGEPPSTASDVYAFGVVVYKMLSGHAPPFRPSTNDKGPRDRFIEGLPANWKLLIESCLEPTPEKRSAKVPDLSSFPTGKSATLRKYSPRIVKITTAAAALLILATAYFFWQSRQYYHPAAQALRWYKDGVAAIHEGTYVKATHALKEAINQDPKFAMAHVRLAEAWENLDFESDAQQEMLLGISGEGALSSLDRLYLEANRLTISHDFPGAVERYKTILDKLPAAEKSNGYVDLGKAYDRAGNPDQAIASYAQASKLDDQSASPYLRTAVLQSRLNHGPEAEAAFQQAEKLFKAESNQEGLAELDFQRGYTYNDHSNPTRAKAFLDRSLEEALSLGSVQLEIRIRTQLSSTLYTSGHAAEAAEQAKQAIQLARDNRIDSWAADGLSRLANAQIKGNDLPGAEQSAREALQLASKSGQLRAQAFANFTIASIMDRKHQPDQIVGPAQAALDYYRPHGFFKPAANSALLLVRAQRDKGLYTQALQSGNEFLDVATKSGDRRLMLLSQENVGSIYQRMEDLVHALEHYEQAKNLADTPDNIERQSEHCAEILWQLGRYAESDALLQNPPADQSVSLAQDKIRLASLLSQGKYEAVLSLSAKALTNLTDRDLDDKLDIQADRAVAAAHLHHTDEAMRLVGVSTPKPEDILGFQSFKLMQAEVELFSGHPEKAKATAFETVDYYQKANKPVSELRGVRLAALAAKKLGDTVTENNFSKQGLDIAAQLQQNWGTQAFQTFASRPDVKTLFESK